MLYDISSLDASMELAKKIAKVIVWPNCICLRGNLGAGKTTLVQFLLAELKVKEEVTSPTFNLVLCYENEDKKKIWHYDLYRLKYEEEILDLAIEDAMNDLVIIEWPEKAESFLPEKRIEINISYDANKRWAEIIYSS
jgi:tRNA threonylcarbamoyladenosine biosynthesis protein TsaE